MYLCGVYVKLRSLKDPSIASVDGALYASVGFQHESTKYVVLPTVGVLGGSVLNDVVLSCIVMSQGQSGKDA